LTGFFNQFSLICFLFAKQNNISKDIEDVSMRLYYLADKDRLKCILIKTIKVGDGINTIKTSTTQ